MDHTYVNLALAFILSFAISYLLTPIVRRLAISYGFVDDPNRNHPAILHNKPIPRAGGVAMYIAFVCTAITFGIRDVTLLALILGGGMNVLIGTLDDKYDLSPKFRLTIQIISALIIVIAGVQIYMNSLFSDTLWYFDYIQFTIPWINLDINLIADALLIFWIVMLMNTTNWTKGASQLPGVAVIAFLTLAAVALKFQAGNPYQIQTAILAVIMAGAVLAFLPFNFPPERMFPGFGASTFIGFMLAVLSVLSGGKFAAIAIVFAIPFIDAILVGSRRLLTGKNPLIHDREHFYHLLLNRGYSKRLVIGLYWISAAAFAYVAYSASGMWKIGALILFSTSFSVLFVLLYRKKQPSRRK